MISNFLEGKKEFQAGFRATRLPIHPERNL